MYNNSNQIGTKLLRNNIYVVSKKLFQVKNMLFQIEISSVQFIHSVLANSLQPHRM